MDRNLRSAFVLVACLLLATIGTGVTAAPSHRAIDRDVIDSPGLQPIRRFARRFGMSRELKRFLDIYLKRAAGGRTFDFADTTLVHDLSGDGLKDAVITRCNDFSLTIYASSEGNSSSEDNVHLEIYEVAVSGGSGALLWGDALSGRSGGVTLVDRMDNNLAC